MQSYGVLNRMRTIIKKISKKRLYRSFSSLRKREGETVNLLHTNVYSEYSLLSSTNRIKELVSKAKETGFTALALTDKGNMFAAVPFYKACLETGVKPVIGLEIPIKDNEHSGSLRLLAKNITGYKSLLKISTLLQTEDNLRAGLAPDDLRSRINDCLIIIPYDSPMHQMIKAGDVEAAKEWCVRWITRSKKEDWYIDLAGNADRESHHWEAVSEFASRYNLKLCGSNPVRFTSKEHYEAYAAVRAIREGKTIHLEDEGHAERSFYLKSKEELKQSFSSVPAALSGLGEIVEQCNITIDLGQRYLPAYPFTKSESAKEALKKACLEGADKRFNHTITDEVRKRLEKELAVIDQMGFNDYFLIVADFMQHARKRNMMTGPGRGSAAGSLTAYVLYITDVNPLKYDLLFERFLNPERISLPDIDIDFPDHRRDEVIQYVQEKYGSDHVAQIATFGTLAARAAIRDTGKALSCDSFLIEKVAKLIPSTPGITIKKAMEQERGLHQIRNDSEDANKLLSIAESIEGLMRHVSTHAAGVVISPVPLTELVALQKGQGPVRLTQATMGIVEEIGLVKFDFLGLRNLTLLERVLSIIEQESGRRVDIHSIPWDDVKTYELLAKGDTTGVFQLESQGMRRVLRSLMPTEFEDIVAVNALYRPGPMDYIQVYINGKHKKAPINNIHEELTPILGKTYGVIVYQEQIMQIAVKMAGFSLARADLLRRAISKKNKADLEKSRGDFLKGAKEKGYNEDIANKVFQLIERFANYGFNRSHAVAYSMISYQLAYLKAHFPTAFYTALLSSVWNTPEKLTELLQETKKREIDIMPPSISKSGLLFTLEDHGHTVRFGLLPVSHVGVQAAKHIIDTAREAPYKDLFDYCVRVNQRIVNRRATENLIKAGAMDEWGEDRATLLYNLDQAYSFAEKVLSFQDEMAGLFTLDIETPQYEHVDPLSLQEKLSFEQEALGVYVSGHPIEQVSDVLAKYQRVPIADMIQDPKGQERKRLRIAGMVSSLKKITTKKGDPMAFLEAADESGQCEVVVFPDVWKQYGTMIREGELLFMEGAFDHTRDKPQFILKRSVLVQSIVAAAPKEKVLYLKLKDQSLLPDVKKLLIGDEGATKVITYLEKERQTIQMQPVYEVGPSEECMNHLMELLGREQVVLK